jgi:hypothetical protein
VPSQSAATGTHLPSPQSTSGGTQLLPLEVEVAVLEVLVETLVVGSSLPPPPPMPPDPEAALELAVDPAAAPVPSLSSRSAP